MGFYSLWIEPERESRLASQLQGAIDELKRQHGGVHFVAHVTLASFEAPDDATAKRLTDDLRVKLKVNQPHG